MTLDPEQIAIHAAEARGLRDNPAFQRAMFAARQRWLEELAVADPLDTEKLRTLQANLKAIHALDAMIADEIIRGMSPRQVVPMTSQDQRYGG